MVQHAHLGRQRKTGKVGGAEAIGVVIDEDDLDIPQALIADRAEGHREVGGFIVEWNDHTQSAMCPAQRLSLSSLESAPPKSKQNNNMAKPNRKRPPNPENINTRQNPHEHVILN